jgi:hypothetical protein
MGIPRVRRRASLLVLCAIFALSSCGFVARQTEPTPIRGLIVDFRAASLTRLTNISVQAEDGAIFEFIVDGDVGITPSHTREHMVLAQPVTVIYRDSPDGPVALRVDD